MKFVLSILRSIWRIRWIIHPSYWFSVRNYNSKWDRELRGLMKNHRFIYDGCLAHLGERRIWTANHPYSSFYDYDITGNIERPSRFTLLMAAKKYEAETGNRPRG